MASQLSDRGARSASGRNEHEQGRVLRVALVVLLVVLVVIAVLFAVNANDDSDADDQPFDQLSPSMIAEPVGYESPTAHTFTTSGVGQ